MSQDRGSSPGGRIRLVVLYGGRSAEHEVSRVTAVGVIRALDPARYQVEPVAIGTEGTWYDAAGARAVLAEAGPAGLAAPLAVDGRVVSPCEALGDPVGTVVFPLLHGPFGEDGTVQGLLEMLGMAYVGSGVLGSAAAMDKVTARRLLASAGLDLAPWIGVAEWECGPDLVERVGDELGWPVFVKPSNLGSSVGVSRVLDRGGLEAAVRLALSYDEWIVIEAAVVGRELECAVLGHSDPRASVVGEVRPSRDFYDYEDKYKLGTAELSVPAAIGSGAAEVVRATAVRAFRAVRAEAMARVDVFLEDSGRVVVNEVNTIPGFTPISMYPRLWEASGLAYPALLDRLVDLALERSARRVVRSTRATAKL